MLDINNLIGHLMLAVDVASQDTSLSRLREIGNTTRQDGIAIVDFAVLGQEADEALCPVL